jgi:histidinol-phosphate aminotransferase
MTSAPAILRREFLRWAGAAGMAAGAGLSGIAAGAGSLRAVTPGAAARPRRRPDVALHAADSPATGVLRLNANENPLGPSPAAIRAIEEGIADANRYPGSEHEALVEALAGAHGVAARQIRLGCGSTELLRAGVSAALAAGGRILMADPTYEDPFDYAQPFSTRAVRVPLDADGAHDLAAMERGLRSDVRLVYICNPNNPSGTIVDGRALTEFVRRAASRATVLVDEAYHDFAADPRHLSMIPLAVGGLPVLVTRTFSKIHALAGLRLGYAIGQEKLLEKLSAYLTFAGANVLALRAARASLDDAAHLERCRAENARARERLSGGLVARGCTVFKSQTNFVMFRLGSDVRGFIRDLEARGVRVGRPFPPLLEHCRVSLGTLDQVDRFLAEFDSWRQAAAA